MSNLIYQRLRFNGQFPTIMSGGMTLNGAAIDGIEVVDYGEEIAPLTPSIDYSQEYFTMTSWEDGNDIC